MDALSVHDCYPWGVHIMTDNIRNTDDVQDSLTEKGVKNRLSGAADQLAGKARNALGALTNDSGQQLQGKAQELKGEAKEVLGKMQMDAARVIEKADEQHRKA